MQTLEYREAHLSERSSRSARAWGSAPSTLFPGTYKSVSVLRQQLPNLLQIKSQEIKHTKSPCQLHLVASLAELLGVCARMRELCPKYFQCCPSLSSIGFVHFPSSDASSHSPLPHCLLPSLQGKTMLWFF